MSTVTLKQIHDDLLDLKKDMEHIKFLVEEDFEVMPHIVKEVEESRKRPRKEFISHEEMRKEFG